VRGSLFWRGFRRLVVVAPERKGAKLSHASCPALACAGGSLSPPLPSASTDPTISVCITFRVRDCPKTGAVR
jgi:hypothetical protein